jgi:hypothetical protein
VIEGHMARVPTVVWNGDILSSGSFARLILQHDMRTRGCMTEEASRP